MENVDFRSDITQYTDVLTKTIDSVDKKQINDVMNVILKAYQNESEIYIFGNGGSAATASHLVCDFNKGVSMKLDKKFRFICLNDNIPTMMAIANDCGYDNVFEMQLEGKLKKGDILIAISGSGNSKNVIKAVEYARSQGNEIVSMTGYGGGQLLKLSDHPIHVNINDMQKVEDVHMMVGHLISQILARHFGHPMC